MKWLGDLWHLTVANAQVGLSYFWLLGYFGAVAMTGLGKFPTNVLADLTPITVMVVSFWFQRQRQSAEDKPSAGPPTPSTGVPTK